MASDADLQARVEALAPVIGTYPPRLESAALMGEVQARYRALKQELDRRLKRRPADQGLRMARATLLAMGHNLGRPGAWQGATHDFQAVLAQDPGHVQALLGLGRLWVDSVPQRAPQAEALFRQAQCLLGDTPSESAQEGLFFAFYLQGKLKEALTQAEFLHLQWPQEPKYDQLNQITRGVWVRSGRPLPTGEQPPSMATCAPPAP